MFFKILASIILGLIFYFFGLNIAIIFFVSWLVLTFIQSLHRAYELNDFKTNILIFLRLAMFSATRKSKWVTGDEIEDYILKEYNIHGLMNRSSVSGRVKYEVAKLVESGAIEKQEVQIEFLSVRDEHQKYGYKTAYAIKDISGGSRRKAQKKMATQKDVGGLVSTV